MAPSCSGMERDRARRFISGIIEWSERKGRDYPWRRNVTPYRTLIAEIMLQRTKADQVTPVYIKFIERFPDADTLAGANLSEIKRFTDGLGLPERAIRLLAMAQEIRGRHNGRIPVAREALLELSGVGEYAADAARIYAFKKKVVAIDSNVVRLLSRFDGRSYGESTRRSGEFRDLCRRLAYEGAGYDFKKFNWGLLDIAMGICRAKPLCDFCPLSADCKTVKLHRTTRSKVVLKTIGLKG